MRPRAARLGLAVALASVLSACSRLHDVSSGTTVTCSSAGECPGGQLCNRGRCVSPDALDTTPPDFVGSIAVSPSRIRDHQTVTMTFEATEPLESAPAVGLGFVPPIPLHCTSAGGTRWACTYTATGQENDRLGGVVGLDVHLRDLTGNDTYRKDVAAVALDFVPPSPTLASVVYEPAPSNPLASVQVATAGRAAPPLGPTVVRVAVSANEVLSAQPPPSLVARLGAAVIPFDLAPGGLDGADARFVTTIAPGQPDGDYALEVAWSDGVGNAVTVAVPDRVVRVKTSTPQLAVDQQAVVFVRSPWGNAAAEDLGGFVVPAGPYFALAPADPLSSVSTLAPGAFALAGGELAGIRVWSDPEQRALVATVFPGPDGAWPRARLQPVDVPWLWVTGLDAAGNESAPVLLRNVEWIATANRPTSATTPHTLQASSYAWGALVPDPATAVTLEHQVSGLDGVSAITRAQVALRRVTPGPTPRPRFGHAMAYDAVRGRVVLFGGSAGGLQYLNDVWEWDGAQWVDRTSAATVRPLPRVYAAMTFDASRGRVVLFGGLTGVGYGADTWEWDGTSWTELHPRGAVPAGRSEHAMTYDSARRVVVLFGGGAGWTPVDALTWEWDGEGWGTSRATGPATRTGHALAYDPARDRTVLYGGSAAAISTELWEYDGVTWSRPAQGGTPGPQDRRGLVFDAGSARLLLVGPTVAAWDGATWTTVTTPGAAAVSLAANAVVAHDARRDRAVVFGGLDPGGHPIADRTWEWSDGGWLDRSARASPPATWDAVLAFDRARGRSVLLGGTPQSGPAGLVWEWDGTGWTSITPAGPALAARNWPAAAWDSGRRRIVLYGGLSGVTPLGELWEWDGSAFSPRTVGSTAPPGRFWAGMAYDEGRGALVLYGGATAFGGIPLDDTWELTGPAVDGTWSWARRANPPPAGFVGREGPSLLFDGTRTLALFGRAAGKGLAEVWRWDGTSWSPLGAAATPGRMDAATAWDDVRRTLLVYGGYSETRGDLGDAWQGAGSAFTALTPPAFAPWPVPQEGGSLAFDAWRGRAVLFDGNADTWEWDADGVATLGVTRQRRAPMVQLTVGYADAGFTPRDVTGLRVRARGAGSAGTGGAGARLLGWRTGGARRAPGAWELLDANGATPPLSPGLPGRLAWTAAAADVGNFFLTRDAVLAFQLRPAGAPDLAEPESTLEADYLEVRVRYAAP